LILGIFDQRHVGGVLDGGFVAIWVVAGIIVIVIK